jgi:hypothetical protein
MLFSFHTITFKKTLSTTDYSRAFYFLKRHKSKFYPTTEDENIWQSDIFGELGIRTYLRHEDGPYPYSEIKFVVNPRLALGDTDYIGIFVPTKDNIRQFLSVMNHCIKKIKLNKLTVYRHGKERADDCTIDDFTISRLDLCVNYPFPTQGVADTYLKLMKRGRWFQYLDEKKPYNEISKRPKKYENAVVLEADSFTISIYSKKAQMLDQIGFFKEIPEAAEGLIRFEIQLEQEKVKRLWNNYSCESLSDFFEQIPEISFSEFRRYMKGLFLKGDYMLFRTAKDRVMKCYPEHAPEIIDFLKLVSQVRSLDEAITEYDTKGLRYDKILRRLNIIKINPVTLPEDDAKEIQYPLLPSIPLILGLLKNG